MLRTHSLHKNALLLRALVLGLLTGLALVLVAVFSARGPLIFLPYAAMFCALAPLLARYRSQTLLARTGAAFAAFFAATLVSYVYIRFVANPGLPQITVLGVVRFVLVMGAGAVLAGAVAFLSTGDDRKTVDTAA